MIEDVRRKEKNRQRLLWGGLAVLSLPAIPILLLDKGMDIAEKFWRRAKSKTRNAHDPLVPAASKGDYAKINSAHPLHQWAKAEAGKDGVDLVELLRTRADKGKPVVNASVFYTGNKAAITFYGDIDTIDPAHTKAIIGHEIGHYKAGNNKNFLNMAMSTTAFYALASNNALRLSLLGQTAHILKDKPFMNETSASYVDAINAVNASALLAASGTLLMASGASWLALAAVSRLMRAFNHSVEHLSDLKAAEIAGPEDTIGVLTYLEEKNNGNSVRVPRSNWMSRALSAAWSPADGYLVKLIKNTHPPLKARADFIRSACGVKDQPPSAEAVSRTEYPAEPAPRVCDKGAHL